MSLVARNLAAPRVRRCRICSCTELQACPDGCYWIGPDLCSACRHKVIDKDFAANRAAIKEMVLRKGDVVWFQGHMRDLRGEVLNLGDKHQGIVAVGVKGVRGIADYHVPARLLTKVMP